MANDRYEAIAREYLAAHETGERVLVVSPANDERRQLNAAIRDLLGTGGHIAAARREQTVLLNRNLTRAQRTNARNYEVGDVVLYRRGSKKLRPFQGRIRIGRSPRPQTQQNQRPRRRWPKAPIPPNAAFWRRSFSSRA